MKLIEIPINQREDLLKILEDRIGLKAAIIEKDWWVTTVLRALFMLPYSQHLSFKEVQV